MNTKHMIIQLANPETATEWVYFVTTLFGGLGGIGTLFLAILYFFQHRTLEEQTKISKLSQTPYLTGPYKFQYNSKTGKYEMYISNAGGGAAENIEMKTKLRILAVDTGQSFQVKHKGLGGADEREEHDEIEIKGGESSAIISREETDYLDIDAVQPRESNVLFQVNPSQIDVEVIDNSTNTPDKNSYTLSEAFPALKDAGVDVVQIHTEITYSDKFGNDEDPFGREYKLYGPNPTRSTDISSPKLSLASIPFS